MTLFIALALLYEVLCIHPGVYLRPTINQSVAFVNRCRYNGRFITIEKLVMFNNIDTCYPNHISNKHTSENIDRKQQQRKSSEDATDTVDVSVAFN